MNKILGCIFFMAFAGSMMASVCPTTSYTNTDCGYIITINPNLSFTGTAVAGANAYDGSDDTLIGVTNDSKSTYNGSFTLTGSGNGGGLFAFESDGICTYTGASYCSTAATGYEGPLNTFSNITTMSVSDDTGTVNITGLAAGASTYFSLESAPSTIGVITITPGTAPEPATVSMLGVGLAAIVFGIKRRRSL